jgi:type IV fimbrial biogenesis protein FimT
MLQACQSGMRARACRGVTLIELLVSLAIVVITMTIAVPRLVEFVAENRRVASVNALLSALNMGRSEAIKRGVRVTLCKTANPGADTLTCSLDADWSAGWILFIDHDNEAGNKLGVIDGSDQTLKVFTPLDGVGISTGGNFAGGVFYEPSGVSGGIRADGKRTLFNDTFQFQSDGKMLCIVVSTTGRAVARRQGQERCGT